MKHSLSLFLLPDFRVTLTENNEKIKEPAPLDWLIALKENANGKGKALSVALGNLCCSSTSSSNLSEGKLFHCKK